MFVKRPVLSLTLVVVANWIVPAHGVEITVDTIQAPDLAEFGNLVKATLEEEFPLAAQHLWSKNNEDPESIIIQFIKLRGVNAYTIPSQNKILASIDYYRNNSEDVGSLYHEMIHVIHKNKLCPAWIYEGLADFMRYWTFELLQGPGAYLRLPTKPQGWAGDHYSQGYHPAAYFINWLNFMRYDEHHRNQELVYFSHWLAGACRQGGNYTEKEIERMFGKSYEDLWLEMLYSEPLRKFRVNVDLSELSKAKLEQHAVMLKKVLEKSYPEIRDFLHSPGYEELDAITVRISTGDIEGFPREKMIRGGEDLLTSNSNPGENKIYTNFETGLIPIVQQYKSGPVWLREGIAMLAKWRNRSEKIIQVSPVLSYMDGDFNTFAFLRWLDNHYKPGGKRLSYWLNFYCRIGTYTDDSFRELTDKTVDELWSEFLRDQKKSI